MWRNLLQTRTVDITNVFKILYHAWPQLPWCFAWKYWIRERSIDVTPTNKAWPVPGYCLNQCRNIPKSFQSQGLVFSLSPSQSCTDWGTNPVLAKCFFIMNTFLGSSKVKPSLDIGPNWTMAESVFDISDAGKGGKVCVASRSCGVQASHRFPGDERFFRIPLIPVTRVW